MGHRQHLAGVELDGFRLRAPVGRGGFGMVWEAESISHARTSRSSAPERPPRVAIKLLPCSLDPLSAERLSSELACLSELDHPNVLRLVTYIPKIHVPDNVNGQAAAYLADKQALVLELGEGGDVAQAVKAVGRATGHGAGRHAPGQAEAHTGHGTATGTARFWRLQPGVAREVILQAARGLAHVHSRNITHCDIKLDNLLLSRVMGMPGAHGSLSPMSLQGGSLSPYSSSAQGGLGVSCDGLGPDVDGDHSPSDSRTSRAGTPDLHRTSTKALTTTGSMHKLDASDILTSGRFTVKVADFGLSRLGAGGNADALVTDEASGHLRAGSLYYMPPEGLPGGAHGISTARGSPPVGTVPGGAHGISTARGSPPVGTVPGGAHSISTARGSPPVGTAGEAVVGPARDTWALGVCLFILLTGRFPFRSKSVVRAAALMQAEDEDENSPTSQLAAATSPSTRKEGPGGRPSPPAAHKGTGAGGGTLAPSPTGSPPSRVRQRATIQTTTSMIGSPKSSALDTSRTSHSRSSVGVVHSPTAAGLGIASPSAIRPLSQAGNRSTISITGAGGLPRAQAHGATGAGPASPSSKGRDSGLPPATPVGRARLSSHASDQTNGSASRRPGPVGVGSARAALAAPLGFTVIDPSFLLPEPEPDPADAADVPGALAPHWYDRAEGTVEPSVVVAETHEAIRAGIGAASLKPWLAEIESTRGAGREAASLLQRLLHPDPACRPSMQDVLHHPWIVKGSSSALSLELLGQD